MYTYVDIYTCRAFSFLAQLCSLLWNAIEVTYRKMTKLISREKTFMVFADFQ